MAFSGAFTKQFRPAFDAGMAAAGNGLLNNLVAYWPLNEVSGNALDLHTNALTLTDTNTVTNAAGKVYATARQYTRANSEYHTRASSAELVTGEIDFTIAIWVYLDSDPGQMYVLTKAAGSVWEYAIDYDATDRFRFWGYSTGVNNPVVSANTLGAASTDTWYLVIGWNDQGAGRVYIQINNGIPDSAAKIGVFTTGTGVFGIGRTPNSTYFNGRIGPAALWKSVLTAAQRTALYNAGAGLAYTAFTT